MSLIYLLKNYKLKVKYPFRYFLLQFIYHFLNLLFISKNIKHDNNLLKIFMEILDYKSTCLNKNELQEYNDVSVNFYSLYADWLFIC